MKMEEMAKVAGERLVKLRGEKSRELVAELSPDKNYHQLPPASLDGNWYVPSFTGDNAILPAF